MNDTFSPSFLLAAVTMRWGWPLSSARPSWRNLTTKPMLSRADHRTLPRPLPFPGRAASASSPPPSTPSLGTATSTSTASTTSYVALRASLYLSRVAASALKDAIADFSLPLSGGGWTRTKGGQFTWTNNQSVLKRALELLRLGIWN